LRLGFPPGRSHRRCWHGLPPSSKGQLRDRLGADLAETRKEMGHYPQVLGPDRPEAGAEDDMPEFDHDVKLLTNTTGRELARVAGVECSRLQPLESSLPATTELLADRAFRASHGRERFVLYFEFYTRWDRNAPWDMLAKSGLLSQREHLPTIGLAFVLQRRGFRSVNGQLRLAVANQPTQHLWFREVPLWQQVPEAWWEGVPGLMALYPLCQHGRTPADALRHAAAAIERGAAPADRGEVLAFLSVFGTLAFPHLKVREIIGMDSIRDTSIIRAFVAETQRRDLGDALRIRFGDQAAAAVLPLLEPLEDSDQLRALLALAIRCASIEEFRAGLPVSPPPPSRPRRRRSRNG
jgi:hypothetical protein